MAEYAYTTVTGKIKPLLEKVRTVGIPSKVTVVWLKTIGYTSSNDKSLIGVLKFIGFIDQSGIPKPTWSAYRGSNHRSILGESIRQGYSDLFATYPDANTRTNTELAHVFSTSSSAGSQAISKTVQTFKALVDEADFSTSVASQTDTALSAGPLHTASAPSPQSRAAIQAAGPEVHIDIQIHISPDSSSEQINQIFESMARHLYGRKDG